MESWRLVFRDGFVPVLSTGALTALRDAVRDNDPRLITGSTTLPPPLMCNQDWVCEGGCAFGFCGVHEGGGFGVATVQTAEEFFARACHEADQRLGEPAACRWFLNHWDLTPREKLFADVLPELELALESRKQVFP